jgi:hypothetical protein
MRGETSVKIVDFEHVNDECEILLHTFNEAGEEIQVCYSESCIELI